jgi:hypothetical protein
MKKIFSTAIAVFLCTFLFAAKTSNTQTESYVIVEEITYSPECSSNASGSSSGVGYCEDGSSYTISVTRSCSATGADCCAAEAAAQLCANNLAKAGLVHILIQMAVSEISPC